MLEEESRLSLLQAECPPLSLALVHGTQVELVKVLIKSIQSQPCYGRQCLTLATAPLLSLFQLPHFTDEETEAKKGERLT